MSEYSEKEIAEARKYVIDLMESDTKTALKNRKEEGLHSTSYPITESYCETGAAYLEFDDFTTEYPKLILGRTGQSLELGLYVGDLKKIAELRLIENFGAYSTEKVREAVDLYFSNVCKIIEGN